MGNVHNHFNVTGRRPWLIVSAEFATTGGQDRANYALACFLAARRQEVHLVAHRVAPELRAEPNVVVHTAAMPLQSAFLGEALLQHIGTNCARVLGKRNAAVVVNGGNCDWPAANWVHYVHAVYERKPTGGLRRAWARAAHVRFLRRERRALSSARVIIANSYRTKSDLMKRLNVEARHIHVVYYGVDRNVFRDPVPGEREHIRALLGLPSKRQLVLFVGALDSDRKGFDLLFEAWRILCADRSFKADVVVLGCGPDLGAWKARVAETQLHSRIHFLGFRKDVASIMRICDVLVAPTRYEAYGLSIHEALCCGLPALASADAGVAELYPGELKELLIPNAPDVKQLVELLRLFIKPPDRVRESLAAFSTRLRMRSWFDMAAEIFEITNNSC